MVINKKSVTLKGRSQLMLHGWRQTGNHHFQSHYLNQSCSEKLLQMFLSIQKSLSLIKLMKTDLYDVKYATKCRSNINKKLILSGFCLKIPTRQSLSTITNYLQYANSQKLPGNRENRKTNSLGKKLDQNSFSKKEIRSKRKNNFFGQKKLDSEARTEIAL